jgi:hypothetical protein
VTRQSSTTSSNFRRSGARALVVLAVLLLLVANVLTAQAADLANYRERVHSASTAIESLIEIDENESDDAYQERFESAITQVRQLLPPQENVTTSDGEIAVDNRWLSDALDAAEVEEESDEFEAALTRIAARLKALEQDIPAASVQSDEPASKDANKARMASILRRGEFNEQNKGESALSRLGKRITDWLARLFRRSGPVDPLSTAKISRISQLVAHGLIVLIILFALRKLYPLIRNRKKVDLSIKGREKVILGERLAANVTPADLLSEAESLAKNGDLRAAIRKGYIAFLCELGDRKLIRIEQNRTNRDYLRNVRDRERLYANMKLLTHSFERHWYGLSPATETDWTEFRSRYGEALK